MRWVNARPNNTISWTVQPHKKSINFGIFKHPGHVAGNPAQSSNIALFPPPSPSLAVTEEDSRLEHAPSTVIEKLKGIGLKQVSWIGKCEADKVNQGRYEVPPGEGGNYALVFDNTFSKNISKTATFFLLTFPSASASQIQFGAQMHHSQAMAGAMAIANATAPSKSPRLRPWGKGSADNLRKASGPVIAEPVCRTVEHREFLDQSTRASYRNSGERGDKALPKDSSVWIMLRLRCLTITIGTPLPSEALFLCRWLRLARTERHGRSL